MTRMSLLRRLLVGGLAASGVGLALRGVPSVSQTGSALQDRVSELLLMGFSGTAPDSLSAKNLADHIGNGRVGGVVFVKDNVGTRDEVAGLVQLFGTAGRNRTIIAIDHEGGAVQRLTEAHGFTRLPAAWTVARTCAPADARALYARAGHELAALGFNLNLAPVVDLHDPDNPAIGRFGRAFSTDPAEVVAYAEAFIEGFASAGVRCALKHFPGEGKSHEDSHDDLPDISATWSKRDLEPFRALIARGQVTAVMSGHVRLAAVDPDPVPVTLSAKAITGLLRTTLGFDGLTLTDDLDMAAVSGVGDRRSAVIRALGAGNNLLMLRNRHRFDPELPNTVAAWVEDAIRKGDLSERLIADSAERVRRFRRTLAGSANARVAGSRA